MTEGEKLSVLEVEKLKLTNDGRGLIIYNDGTNFLKGTNWNGSYCPTGALATNISGTTGVKKRRFLCAASSSGWLKIHVISGSTFGATGATYYVPVFSNPDTKISV